MGLPEPLNRRVYIISGHFIKQGNILCMSVIVDIYSFVPVYGLSRWYNRNGKVDESVLLEILQGVNIKV